MKEPRSLRLLKWLASRMQAINRISPQFDIRTNEHLEEILRATSISEALAAMAQNVKEDETRRALKG